MMIMMMILIISCGRYRRWFCVSLRSIFRGWRCGYHRCYSCYWRGFCCNGRINSCCYGRCDIVICCCIFWSSCNECRGWDNWQEACFLTPSKHLIRRYCAICSEEKTIRRLGFIDTLIHRNCSCIKRAWEMNKIIKNIERGLPECFLSSFLLFTNKFKKYVLCRA